MPNGLGPGIPTQRLSFPLELLLKLIVTEITTYIKNDWFLPSD